MNHGIIAPTTEKNQLKLRRMKMKKQATFIRTFENESEAEDFMTMKNRVNRVASWIWVLVEGPEDNFAVVDLSTAIEMNVPYKWSTI
jgi:hypothetical protein